MATRQTTWVPGQTLTAAALNAEFDEIFTNITNANIAAGAAIVRSKLAATETAEVTFTKSGRQILLKPSTDPAANTKLFEVQNAAGTSLFSVDIEGDVRATSLEFGTNGRFYTPATSVIRSDSLIDVVRGLATDRAFGALVTGDAQARLYINADGKMEWGPGNAVRDISLYRSAASTLSTNGHLFAGFNLKARVGTAAEVNIGDVGGNATILFGSAGDVNVYRSAADVLKTDDSFEVGVRLRYPSGQTQTTVGAAGAASALPANPTGYWKLDIGGTTYVVPYYAAA